MHDAEAAKDSANKEKKRTGENEKGEEEKIGIFIPKS